MIEGEVVRPAPAILAGVAIPEEDLAPGQFDARPGRANQTDQTDHRGVGEDILRGCDRRVMRLQDLGFATEHQHEGAPNVADIEGFVILVENQNGFVHARNCSR